MQIMASTSDGAESGDVMQWFRFADSAQDTAR